MCNIIARKFITDKQIRYIINQVHLPAITYLLNDMVLSQNTCNHIAAMIGKTIKHKLHLSNTTPNNVIYNPLEYGFFHIWDRQIIHHSSRWTERINSMNIAGNIVRIRL
jgi:hypothetical protein